MPNDESENQRTDVTRSELIESLVHKHPHLDKKDIELAVKLMLEQISQSLQHGERIEIRGFGSFSLRFHPPRLGRNPRTGEPVALSGVYVPHFKPGKELRDRVNAMYVPLADSGL